MRKRIYSITLFLLLTSTTLFLIEITIRFFVFKKNSVYTEAYENLIKGEPKFTAQPYLNYINNPNFINGGGVHEVNRSSIRNTSQTSLKKPAHVYRILFLGGSTTFGELDVNNTFPALLEQSFNRQIKTLNIKYAQVECLNAGLPSGTSAEILTHYLFKLNYLNPDLIVIHAGVNDAITYLFLGSSTYHPDYHTTRIVFQDIEPLSPLLRYLLVSKTVGFLVLRFMYGDNMSSLRENLFFESKNKQKNEWFTFGNDSMFSPQYNAFYNNIKNLLTIAKAKHQKVLLVSDVVNEHEAHNFALSDSVKAVIMNGLQKHKEFLYSLSHEFSVPVCYLKSENFPSGMFPAGDGIHVNEKGEKEKARLIEEYILAILKSE